MPLYIQHIRSTHNVEVHLIITIQNNTHMHVCKSFLMKVMYSWPVHVITAAGLSHKGQNILQTERIGSP